MAAGVIPLPSQTPRELGELTGNPTVYRLQFTDEQMQDKLIMISAPNPDVGERLDRRLQLLSLLR